MTPICGCHGQLLERLTFDKLLAYSEPKRVLRAKTVRGPPLEVEARKDGVFYHFNFKSFPSTTGHRHRGYIKFFKPKKKMPLERIDCLADCACPDYRYRWAWVNKQKGSSVVGPKSMNQAWNKAPKITNPRGRPGLCKHLIALRDFIYGEFENFDGEGDAAERLDAVVKSVQTKAKTGEKTPVKPKKPDEKKPDPKKKQETPPEAPVKPAGRITTEPGSSRRRSQKLPDEFSDQVMRRFTNVESVDRPVSPIANIIRETEEVEVDAEESEALQLLREIRDALLAIQSQEDSEDEPEDKPEPEPEPAAEDDVDLDAELPAPGEDDLQP